MVASFCNEQSWWSTIYNEPTWALDGRFSRARVPSWSCPPWSDRLPRPSHSRRPGTVSQAPRTRWCSTSWGENPDPRHSRILRKVYPHLQNTKQLNNQHIFIRSHFYFIFIKYIKMHCGTVKHGYNELIFIHCDFLTCCNKLEGYTELRL